MTFSHILSNSLLILRNFYVEFHYYIEVGIKYKVLEISSVIFFETGLILSNSTK